MLISIADWGAQSKSASEIAKKIIFLKKFVLHSISIIFIILIKLLLPFLIILNFN